MDSGKLQKNPNRGAVKKNMKIITIGILFWLLGMYFGLKKSLAEYLAPTPGRL